MSETDNSVFYISAEDLENVSFDNFESNFPDFYLQDNPDTSTYVPTYVSISEPTIKKYIPNPDKYAIDRYMIMGFYFTCNILPSKEEINDIKHNLAVLEERDSICNTLLNFKAFV